MAGGTDNFWNIPDITNFRTPLIIMREQAQKLTEKTEGTLKGVTQISNSENVLFIGLYISVPKLNNYMLRIASYMQPISIYPGTYNDEVVKKQYHIASEQSFLEALKSTLGSEQMSRIIASLISQAND